MIRRLPYFSALVATLLGALISNAARADIKSLVDAGKISWEGSPEVSWVGDDSSQLLLKYTNTAPDVNSFKLAESIKAQVRVVAVGGGGAGGTSHTSGFSGGGGGAGAVVDWSDKLESGDYAIVVGAGGTKAADDAALAVGNDGSASSFGGTLVNAIGGGGGGAASVGNDGACGGGGSGNGSTASKKKVGGSALVSDGYAGGESKNSGGFAGGGGGMGGAGGVTSSSSGGVGGSGKTIDITGESITVAAGGGGGRYSGKTPAAGGAGGGGTGGAGGMSGSGMVEAGNGTDGTGSGGGGSGNYLAGGKGGNGVVYVRVLMAAETKIDIPVIADTEYTGDNVIAFDFGFAYEYISGVTNAVDAGTYAFDVRPMTDFEWKGEGGRAVKTITWKIVPYKVEKPTAKPGLIYNGSEQTGSDIALVDYTLAPGSVVKATNAGSYSFTAILVDKSNTCWEDGETADLKVDWAIAPKAVDRPVACANLVYNGKWQNGYKKLELQYYTVTPEENTNRLDAGDYPVTFALKNPTVKNYAWNDDPLAYDDWNTSWSIAKAANKITNLKIGGWKIGSTPIAPTCDATWGKDTVQYDYSMDPENGPWVTSAAELTQAGTWYVRAIVPEAKNWTAATNTTDFFLFDDPNLVYAYSVEMTFSNTGSAATDYQALIEISPDTIHGFTYADAGADGKSLFIIGPDGNPLSYKVVSWNVNGTSKLGILIKNYPVGNTTVTLYWGVRPGQTAPKYDDTGVKPPTKTTSAKFALAKHDGKMINYWVKEPAISPTIWDVDAASEARGKVTERGELAAGTVSNYYYDVYAPTNVYSDISEIVKVGYYRAVFTQKDPEGYEPIEKVIDLRVTASDPYISIQGVDGDSGRVLLMNNDKLKDGTTSLQVNYQGYVDTAKSGGTYWVIPNVEGEAKQGSKSDLKQSNITAPASDTCPDFNIKVGRSSTLMKKDGSRLWHLEDCRHGNTYMFDPASKYKETYSLNAKQNYLPFSDVNSYDIMAKLALGTKAKRRSAGQIVMRNRTTAAVYSPCFTNGLGTVYFDAVNGWVNDGSGYKIAVQWSTNAVDSAGEKVLPIDANSFEDEEGVTNWYAKLEWHDAEMVAYKRDGSTSFDTPVTKKELPLDVTTGGSNQNFYRIAVPLNFEVPARIRIVRRSTDTSFRTNDEEEKPQGGSSEKYGYDNGGFVLLDNIIVSYPPMWAEMVPLSKLDESRHGKQALGYEISTTVPYPTIGETKALMRAKVLAHVNDGKKDVHPEQFVSSAKAHYRWRYLNQQFGEWKVLDLNPMNDYQSMSPVEIPAMPGDIEYWLDCNLQAPFYSYVDYSGLNLGIPYSEERKTAVSSLNAKTEIISGGTNWFFRLRDGKSDRQGVKVVVEGELKGEYELSLMGDHTWRGFIPNPTNTTGVSTFRFVGYNLQTPGALEYVTNSVVWGAAGGYTVEEMPANGKLSVDGEGIEFAVSHLANYYEVRMNEETLSWSFCTAEYQDFNQWSDAAGAKFVGSSAMGNRKGVAPSKITYVETFDDWGAMNATSTNWTLFSFADLGNLYGRTAYKQQASDTDGSWSIGPGMWIAKYYADQSGNAEGAGVAYQMKGCGEGFVQFTEKDNAPRGIESISFNARLGQYINFSDFSFYDGDAKSKMTNYVFTARGAFDHNNNQNFSGNASLSLVAYYRENKGCYEARWEQLTGKWTKKYSQGGKCSGINEYGQRLCLYRWYRDPSSGKMEATLLGSWANNGGVKIATGIGATENSSSAQPLMISVENTDDGTRVAVGVATAGTFGEAYTADKSRSWYGFCIVDNDAKKLTSGTYGLLTANCPGRFNTATAYKYKKPITWAGFGLDTKTKGTYANKSLSSYFPTTIPTAAQGDFDNDNWVVTAGRMAYDNETALKGYLVAKAASQSLNVWMASAGKSDWKLLKTIDVGNSFGKSGSQSTHKVDLYNMTNCSVRISTGGVFDDPRNDVVIDSVVIKQFRGNDYADSTEMVETVGGKQRIPGWNDPKDAHGMTNFVFTSAWIKNNDKRTAGSILLSARRTLKSKISGIRSPLLDGYYKRGKGLGMYSFEYANAQANAKLLVQVATNGVSYTDYANYDDLLAPSYWATVEAIDFSTMTEDQRKSGSFSYYFGIHGKAAGVRLIVDPAAATAVAGQTDTSKFGEVEITKVLIRDEPALDASCWTGWNLRMIGANKSGDTEKRMYLPDYADALENRGMSAALNKSVTADVDPSDDVTYKQNMPFVQSPIFGEGIVGELTFKARKYGEDPTAQPANVRIYGSKTGSASGSWELVGDVTVTNEIFTTYSYRVDMSRMFKAFRLGVTGATGVNPEVKGPVMPEGYNSAVRVLLDEVIISQAIEARMGFRNVGTFKSNIVATEIVPNVPSRSEQPLAMESWGVQCELYGAQQPDEIDFEHTPTVKLHWYTGTYPWGYDRWKDKSGAKSAYLRLATDSGVSNWVYRSSQRACPEAVIPMATQSPTVVQYTLEVIFYTKDGDTPRTNWLSSAEWVKPEWYNPLDYNADYPDFAAYNILDNVAPGWAWINEVNLFGSFDDNLNNSESDRQYIEIAQPPEAEILDWEVRLLERNSTLVLTNVLAVFGRDGLSAKKDSKYIDPTANMVFRTLANKAARETGNLKFSDGTLDAVWKVDNPTTYFTEEGVLSSYISFAVQLVRSSGIVEHEIVVMGTNWWSDLPTYRDAYHPTNLVNFLNANLRNADFLYVGKEDDGGDGKSLSVTNGSGSAAVEWTNQAKWTPGRLNEWQRINPDHPVPSGESIIIYASVSGQYIAQRGEDGEYTDQMQMYSVQKGSSKGTNIYYRVDPWYVLGSVTTNSISAAGGIVRVGSAQPKYYEINVGKGCSNNVNVVAEAAPDPKLAEKYGIAEDDEYRPAILDWLRGSCDAHGNKWENVEDDNIYLADFLTLKGTFQQQLTLKEMYWLDMDPTVTNQALIGGVTAPPVEHKMAIGGEPVTNIRYEVYMMFTNRTEDAADFKHYGKSWTPYTLRGLEPGSVSLKYDEKKDDWNGPTFKATGIMLNGLTDPFGRENWMPLRWFTFNDGSFTSAGTSKVEIEDPYWHGSVGYNTGWGAYMKEHGWQQIVYFWALDTRIRPVTIEMLKPVNHYDE